MTVTKKSSNKPISRLINATRYSMNGLRTAWKDEQAFRLEVTAVIVLLPIAVWLPIEHSQRVALILTMIVVLIVELLNSAIEAITDLVTEDFHPLAKKAKDFASAAVFISLICSGGVWLSCLYQLFLKYGLLEA